MRNKKDTGNNNENKTPNEKNKYQKTNKSFCEHRKIQPKKRTNSAISQVIAGTENTRNRRRKAKRCQKIISHNL